MDNETRLNILIVDDEQPAIDNLKYVVNRAAPEANVAATTSCHDAIDAIAGGIVDVAMLDIEMPEMSGIKLAKRMKEINPQVNIIFVTAYTEYAITAMKERASGYLLKPASVEDVRTELDNLRNPVQNIHSGLYVKCFGRFEVYYNDEPVSFSRSAEKEILAYLIDLNGDGANTNEICTALWETPDAIEKRKNYFRVLMGDLRKKLAEIGAEDILVKKRNYFAIDTAKVHCDYYEYLKGNPSAVNSYRGEYMVQYSWSEFSSFKRSEIEG